MSDEHEDDFQVLLERVKSLTGLHGRDAAKVAFEFEDPTAVSPQQIVDKAIELGYDVEKKHGQKAVAQATPIPEVTFNPAEVLSEVYMVMPRVLCQHTPKLGRAPAEAQEFEGMQDLIDELPEEIRVLLVKIDVLEGAATFWLRDEANDVDRPIGPIDLNQWINEEDVEGSHARIEAAFRALLTRVNKVITADYN
jgi:hypothetical protein